MLFALYTDTVTPVRYSMLVERSSETVRKHTGVVKFTQNMLFPRCGVTVLPSTDDAASATSFADDEYMSRTPAGSGMAETSYSANGYSQLGVPGRDMLPSSPICTLYTPAPHGDGVIGGGIS